eukprot:scaffold1967_cov199-Alexandrium_tamarense.AAC.20
MSASPKVNDDVIATPIICSPDVRYTPDHLTLTPIHRRRKCINPIRFANPFMNCRSMSTEGTNKDTNITDKLEQSKCPSTGEPLQTPAGLLFHYDSILNPHTMSLHDDDEFDGKRNDELDYLLPKDEGNLTEVVKPPKSDFFIPQVKLNEGDGSGRKRVLV